MMSRIFQWLGTAGFLLLALMAARVEAEGGTYRSVICPHGDCTRGYPSESVSETHPGESVKQENVQRNVQEDEEDEDEEDDDEEDECVDLDPNCAIWVQQRQCFWEHVWMSENCAASCNTCKVGPPGQPWQLGLGDDMGMAQQLIFDHGATKEQVLWELAKARSYMQETGWYGSASCLNKEPLCAFWAYIGECEENPTFMYRECAPVCEACGGRPVQMKSSNGEDDDDDEEEEDMSHCFEGLENVWKTGDLNRMFERIAANTTLDVTVLSSPEDDGPWVIQIDDFITKEEAQTIIFLGTDIGYARSTTVDVEQEDGSLGPGENEDRTSSNAWCQEECKEDASVKAVTKRLEDLTGIPFTNSEDLQLLQYTIGQKYESHHDLIEDQIEIPAGPRILTGYMYLNNVREGGGTYFDKLDVTVEPKQGRLVLWPSVLDWDVETMDPRTTHAALPVLQGTKYGANAWFHLRDYQTPFLNGCFYASPPVDSPAKDSYTFE